MIGERIPFKRVRMGKTGYQKHWDIDWMLFSELDNKLSARLYWQFSCRLYSYFGTAWARP